MQLQLEQIKLALMTLAVNHTDRNGVIRIISARPATRKERKIYEEG
jgi:uncharacterized DUF497 family protein